MELGISDTLIGFRLLEQLIGLVVEDPSMERHISGEASAVAAERVGTTFDSVKRSTRYALHEAVVRGNFEVRAERVGTKYDIPDFAADIITNTGAISVKKLVLKVAHALGDSWDEEVR